MAVIAIPKILTDRLTEEGARALVEILDKFEKSSQDQTVRVVEDRFEKRLIEEISRLEVKIQSIRADLIMWMFIFWVGQVGTITAILFAFFKR